MSYDEFDYLMALSVLFRVTCATHRNPRAGCCTLVRRHLLARAGRMLPAPRAHHRCVSRSRRRSTIPQPIRAPIPSTASNLFPAPLRNSFPPPRIHRITSFSNNSGACHYNTCISKTLPSCTTEYFVKCFVHKNFRKYSVVNGLSDEPSSCAGVY